MDVFSEKVSSLPSAQRSYTSELSWYPEFGLRSEFSSVFGVFGVVGELSWCVGIHGRKGTWSSPVTKAAAVTMAAELL
jgi:hypothetical protein